MKIELNETDAYSTEVTFQLKSSAKSLKQWPYRFELLLRVTVGPTLTIALTTKNCDEHPFEITSALHSYFAVSDLDNVYVEGLDNTPYFDALIKENRM